MTYGTQGQVRTDFEETIGICDNKTVEPLTALEASKKTNSLLNC